MSQAPLSAPLFENTGGRCGILHPTGSMIRERTWIIRTTRSPKSQVSGQGPVIIHGEGGYKMGKSWVPPPPLPQDRVKLASGHF